MSPYAISAYVCLYMKKGPTIVETAVDNKLFECSE